MKSRVLDAADNAEDWNQFLQRVPWGDDTYFQAEYVRLQETADRQARLFCFSYPEQNFFYAYPFLLQRIPESLSRGRELYDIETAYGYGGPLASSPSQELCQKADDAFCAWARTQSIVAEFIRYHPLAGNQHMAPSTVTVLEDRPTCSIELSTADLLQSFHGKARNMVRRAMKVCTTEFLSCREFSNEFRDLYEEDMRRLDAGSDYFFGETYFERLADLVDERGFMIAVREDDNLVGAAMFLHGRRCAHYHLSTTRTGPTTPGLVNLILWVAAEEAAKRGLELLHLGGGRTAHPDDSLLKFKRRMGGRNSTFYIGKRVHSADAYESLSADWARNNPELAQEYGSRLLCYRYQPHPSAP